MRDIEKEIQIDTFSFGEPYNFVKSDSIVQCTMAQTMVMSSKDSTYEIRSKIYLLGISTNSGKTWFFLDSTNGAEFLDAVEPRRLKNYQVPDKEQSFTNKEKKN
jgi:hypothetical protein